MLPGRMPVVSVSKKSFSFMLHSHLYNNKVIHLVTQIILTYLIYNCNCLLRFFHPDSSSGRWDNKAYLLVFHVEYNVVSTVALVHAQKQQEDYGDLILSVAGYLGMQIYIL